MSEPIWNKFLTERDKAVFATSGYGARGGFGKRPALLIIDVNYAFCDERPTPILESIKRWRNSCGEDAGIAPTLDRYEDRGGALVTERVVHVDDQERGALAESAACAIAGRREYRFVALGEELVPNGL